jgi:predicted nucleic acid-binding Zn ribbon protein
MLPVAEALKATIADAGLTSVLGRYDAITRWAEVVGPQIAAVASAERIENGIVYVKVTNAPWRAELTLRRVEIIKKLNEALGHEAVKEIRFR